MESEHAVTNLTKGSGWGQNRRLEFIDFRLLWEGRINRADLTTFFGISVPQASLDLARYQEMAPENMKYDQSDKVYVATAEFEPLISMSDPSGYLNSLLAVNLGVVSKEMSFVGSYPTFDSVVIPSRKIETKTLYQVLKAIKNISVIEIDYQSLSSPEPSAREISPHAIAFDGFRWHARAYCHRHNDFRDFLFARILDIRKSSPSNIDSLEDEAWHQFIKLILVPHPDLSPAQRRVIELDYDMKQGSVTIETRRALLFYTLQHLRLNKLSDSAQAVQIVLANHDEISSYL